jgi:MinD-like ATPase involved in chromosome partitioning or flagellar assembly
MSVVCLTSAHGSPGVTTTALALAATWPSHRRCLLVEADLFGGVIAARYGLGDTPGLSSLAADSRRGLDDDVVWRHAQYLPGGVPVLVGPATPDEAHAVLRDIADALTAWSTEQIEIDVIIDCGRIPPGLSTIDTIGEAGVVMVLTRPTLDQLRPAAHRLGALKALGIDVGLLLVGDEPYGPAEVTAALQMPVVGIVAWDPRTAAVLTGARGSVRDLRRSPLVRSVETLAERLAPTRPSRPEPGHNTQLASLVQPKEQVQEATS